MPYYINDMNPDCNGWAVEKEDGEVIGCHTTKQDAIDQMVAVSISEDMEPGGERADAPAPKKDQITGSDKNEPGSASGKSGAIELSDAVETALENKAGEHNEKMAEDDRPVWTRVRVGALRSVYRRGAGAYSSSHRPGVSRGAWAMARVNAFLYLARTGRPENDAYVGDNDLLHPEHPKYSKEDTRALPDNYRPSLSPDVPNGRACGNCAFYDETKVMETEHGLEAWCHRWDDYVQGDFYCNAWQPHEEPEEEEEEEEQEEMENEREVSLNLPQYIRAAARRGLDYYARGWAGDGLVDRTVREAREMAAGRITEDKVIRANAWGARHMVDLDAPKNSDPDNDEFPGPGAVAFYLWGIDPLDPEPAMNWFAQKAEAIDQENEGREVKPFYFQRKTDDGFGTVVVMDNKVETRRVTFNDFELRQAPSGDGMSFTGYAAVFNSDSEPLPFIERILPGAFSKSLKSRNNIRMYMNHDSSMLLATTRAKTLRLQEDSKGLLVDADLPDTTVGRDLSVLMQRKDVDSMSFGFTVPSGGDRWSDDGMTRELKQVRLFEVSVVTGFPAYTATSASVRSVDALATRTGIDADKLAAAITVLESGQNLSADHAALLRETVAKLEPAPSAPPAHLAVMQKHLDLLKNAL